MAISFNNEYKDTDMITKSKDDPPVASGEPSFVMIYVNRISPKNPGAKMGTRDPYVKMIKLILPLSDFQGSVSIRQQLAVTVMDFDMGGDYLQLCVQRINHENVLDTANYRQQEDCFIIWDIMNNTQVQNFESID